MHRDKEEEEDDDEENEEEEEVEVLLKMMWSCSLPQFIGQCCVVVVLEFLQRGEEREEQLARDTETLASC